MKKVFALVLAVLMVATLSVAVVSADPSPTVTSPTVVSVVSSNADWNGELIIYREFSNVEAALIEELKKAIEDEKTLNLVQLVGKNNVAIQDSFGIEAIPGDYGTLTITLDIGKDLDFAALLHYNNNDWEVVGNATYDKATGYLTFTVDSFSPFAIVVNKASTGDFGYWFYVVIALVAGTAAVVLFVVGKKKTIDG